MALKCGRLLIAYLRQDGMVDTTIPDGFCWDYRDAVLYILVSM
jgi:hypothetical protein